MEQVDEGIQSVIRLREKGRARLTINFVSWQHRPGRRDPNMRAVDQLTWVAIRVPQMDCFLAASLPCGSEAALIVVYAFEVAPSDLPGNNPKP